MVGAGSTLSFHLSSGSAGEYSCSAQSADYPAVSREVMVTMRGVARLRQEVEQQWSSVGSRVSLVCEGSAVPRVQEVVWRHQGRHLGENENDLISLKVTFWSLLFNTQRTYYFVAIINLIINFIIRSQWKHLHHRELAWHQCEEHSDHQQCWRQWFWRIFLFYDQWVGSGHYEHSSSPGWWVESDNSLC